MKKTLYIIAAIAALVASSPASTEQRIYQTNPGGWGRDITKPVTVIKDNGDVYQTIPGGWGKDPYAPTYQVRGSSGYSPPAAPDNTIQYLNDINQLLGN